MKTLLICDNRDAQNWGCRATSIALMQILGESSSIDSTSRELAALSHPVGPLTKTVGRHRTFQSVINSKKAKRYIDRSLRLFGFRDFVRLRPEKSLKAFLKMSDYDSTLAELRATFDEADKVVINGEGSLIFRTPPRRDLNFQLFAVELAVYLGKPVYYVNAMASDCPKTGPNPSVEDAVAGTLSKASWVLTRDPMSERRLLDLGLENVNWNPDALFTWHARYKSLIDNTLYRSVPEVFDSWPESDYFFGAWNDWPKEYICVSGASRPPGVNPNGWLPLFRKVMQRIQSDIGLPVVIVDPGGDSFLRSLSNELETYFIRPTTNILLGAYILANAKAYLSGRYHPSIMASMGGTPCTFLGANSHKTYSLQAVLNYNDPRTFPFSDQEENVKAIVGRINRDIGQGSVLRTRIRETTYEQGIVAKAGFLRI